MFIFAWQLQLQIEYMNYHFANLVVTIDYFNWKPLNGLFGMNISSVSALFSKIKQYSETEVHLNPKSATYNLQQTTISNFAAFSK